MMSTSVMGLSQAAVSFSARQPKKETMVALAQSIQTRLQDQFPGATCTFQNESYLKAAYPKGVFTITPKRPESGASIPANGITLKGNRDVQALLEEFGAQPKDGEYWQLKGAHVRFSTFQNFRRGG